MPFSVCDLDRHALSDASYVAYISAIAKVLQSPGFLDPGPGVFRELNSLNWLSKGR